MLFGRNTTGGAVLLVPQRSTDKLEGYVEGSYGNHDFKRVQAAANLPLADTFRVRLGVDRMKREGYLHNRSGIGPDEFNNVNYSAARLSVLAELTPELENALIASYSRSNTHGNLGRVADCDRSMATNQQIVASLIAKPGQGVGGVVPINAGKSRIRGIEVESSIVVSEGLRLDASYAYLDARIISITPPTLSPTDIYSAILPNATAGQAIVYAPKHKVSATATYTLPLDESIGKVSLGATYTYTSGQYATHSDDAFVARLGYNPGYVPATGLVNLNLNWNEIARAPIDLSLFVTNVTDKHYRIGTTGAFSSTGFETWILGQPRMYGARLRYRFGG